MLDATQTASPLLDYGEAAQYLRIGQSTLKAMRARGEIAVVIVSHRVLFERAALDDYIARRRSVGRPTAGAA